MDGTILQGRELTVVFAEENRKKPTEMRARERGRLVYLFIYVIFNCVDTSCIFMLGHKKSYMLLYSYPCLSPIQIQRTGTPLGYNAMSHNWNLCLI